MQKIPKKEGFTKWAAEPINLAGLVGTAFKGYVEAFKTLISSVEASDFSEKYTNGKEKFKALEKNFDDNTRKAWRNYIIVAVIVQVFFGLNFMLQIATGNWFSGLQMLLMFVVAYFGFGFRTWILREQNVQSFLVYLRDACKNPMKACVFNALHLMK
jgi:hypothetical protein